MLGYFRSRLKIFEFIPVNIWKKSDVRNISIIYLDLITRELNNRLKKNPGLKQHRKFFMNNFKRQLANVRVVKLVVVYNYCKKQFCP